MTPRTDATLYIPQNNYCGEEVCTDLGILLERCELAGIRYLVSVQYQFGPETELELVDFSNEKRQPPIPMCK